MARTLQAHFFSLLTRSSELTLNRAQPVLREPSEHWQIDKANRNMLLTPVQTLHLCCSSD